MNNNPAELHLMNVIKKSIKATIKDDVYQVQKYLIIYNGNPNIPLYVTELLTYSPLSLAAELGHTEIIDVLLNHPDIDVNYMPEIDYGHSVIPIVGAIRNGYKKSLTTIKKLLDKGANINMVDYDARTPLLHACEIGLPDTVEFLLDNHADINNSMAIGFAIKCHDFYGKVPLTQRYVDHTKVFELLLDAGATGANYSNIQSFDLIGLIKKWYQSNKKLYDVDKNINVDPAGIYKYIKSEKGQEFILSKLPELYNKYIENHIKIHPNIQRKYSFAASADDLNLL